MKAELTEEEIGYRSMLRKEENNKEARQIESCPTIDELHTAIFNKKEISIKVINTKKRKSSLSLKLSKICLDKADRDFIFYGTITKSAMKGAYEKGKEVQARLYFKEDSLEHKLLSPR